MSSPDSAEKIHKYVTSAFSAARSKIDREYAVKIANAREELALKGLTHSSVMDERTTRLHADQIAATVKAKADALLEAYQIYGVLIDDAVRDAILDDVERLHEILVKGRSSTARAEAEQQTVRTNSDDRGGLARARKFSRDIDRFTTDILNEIAVEIERKRAQQKDNRQQNVRRNQTSPGGTQPHELSDLHPEIAKRCIGLYENGDWAESVEKSFKVVRDRLRDLTGRETGSEAFGKTTLHVKGAAAPHVDYDFNEGVKFLTMAIDKFRNEKAHTADGNIQSPLRAYEYLRLSSLAMHLLDNAEMK